MSRLVSYDVLGWLIDSILRTSSRVACKAWALVKVDSGWLPVGILHNLINQILLDLNLPFLRVRD